LAGASIRPDLALPKRSSRISGIFLAGRRACLSFPKEGELRSPRDHAGDALQFFFKSIYPSDPPREIGGSSMASPERSEEGREKSGQRARSKSKPFKPITWKVLHFPERRI
jgi:hypothetical protein